MNVQKQKMYSKAQLKISLCEPSPQSDRHFLPLR